MSDNTDPLFDQYGVPARSLTPSEANERMLRLIGLSEQVYVEHIFHKVLDMICAIAPSINTPYLETKQLGDGLYEVNLLIHVTRHKGDHPNEQGPTS